MSRPQKKRNRREIRRRRQSREKNQRLVSRDEKKYTEGDISILLFLKRYIFELFLIICLIIGIVFVKSLGPDKEAAQKLQESFDPALYGESLEWDKVFTGGYKILVLTEKDIIQTSFDTLPDDLKINWKKMSVTRIQANQLGNTIEKIKIIIKDINYAPADVSGLTAIATLSRQKGVFARLAVFSNFEFIAKIVRDDAGQLFCLLGLREL